MGSSLAPNSPTTSDDEDTLSLDMELKRGQTDEENGLKGVRDLAGQWQLVTIALHRQSPPAQIHILMDGDPS